MSASQQDPANLLSVVIPAYNEERRLPTTLEQVKSYLQVNYSDFEVLVINDGSHDQTSQVVQDAMLTFPQLQLLEMATNSGKGAAVKRGLQRARGQLRLFSDADLSTPLHCLPRLVQAIEDGAAVAIGSRAHPDSVIPRSQAPPRQRMGQIFNLIMRLLVGLPFTDTQCGFKLFTASAIDKVLPLARINGFAFDVELLAIARLHGLRITDCPVEWSNDADSKVNVFIHPLAMLRELVQIRLNMLAGHYRKISA